MRKTIALAALLVACQPGAGGEKAPAALDTEDAQAAYALGFQLGRNVAPLELGDQEIQALGAGLADAAAGDEPRIPVEGLQSQVQALVERRASRAAADRRQAEEDFLEEARAEEGAQVLESGVIILHEREGEGEVPEPSDQVTVHYHGTFPDGEVFDSSMERGQPASFALTGIIPCWTQALQEMKVGGRARVVCPADTAYGDRGAPPRIPPGAALIFQIELMGIQE